MATARPGYVASNPSYVEAPRAMIRFRLLRDGEVTSSEKILWLHRSWETLTELSMAFVAEAPGGEFTAFQAVDLATLQAEQWIATGRDDVVLPRRVRTSYLSLTGDGTYTFNISSGEGGGDVGSPATLTGIVRVEGVSADRQVVVIERPPDGEWRLAGFGPTPGGSGVIDVRVTDGAVYAVGLDDWGVVFTPDQPVQVGQTVRPTNFTGWLYRITQAGALPSAEPQWWAAQGENPSRPLGTARAIAVRYHQPQAHGPLPVEIT